MLPPKPQKASKTPLNISATNASKNSEEDTILGLSTTSTKNSATTISN
jgi:hypothetical protein